MNVTVLNYPESIPVFASRRGERIKGGEKTKSEWEELEKLTKGELIIELVKWKTLYSILRKEQGDDCPWYAVERKTSLINGEEEPGELTSHEWAEKIALYGAMHPKDGAFFSCDLMDYGLTGDQADEICEELREKGLLKLPNGTEYEPGDD